MHYIVPGVVLYFLIGFASSVVYTRSKYFSRAYEEAQFFWFFLWPIGLLGLGIRGAIDGTARLLEERWRRKLDQK